MLTKLISNNCFSRSKNKVHITSSVLSATIQEQVQVPATETNMETLAAATNSYWRARRSYTLLLPEKRANKQYEAP